jgi:hypothetical protein
MLIESSSLSFLERGFSEFSKDFLEGLGPLDAVIKPLFEKKSESLKMAVERMGGAPGSWNQSWGRVIVFPFVGLTLRLVVSERCQDDSYLISLFERDVPVSGCVIYILYQ